MNESKLLNYYEILKIPQESTKNEIKKSYYNLAKQYHPDKNKTLEAENMFKDINIAYKVLSDDFKREEYDLELKKRNSSSASFHYMDENDQSKLKK
jgi:DnaJ-class molecular chaperone